MILVFWACPLPSQRCFFLQIRSTDASKPFFIAHLEANAHCTSRAWQRSVPSGLAVRSVLRFAQPCRLRRHPPGTSRGSAA
ncbi:hypothetical protein [Thermaurantimonas aggregans]|uniref:hypothetical protein n=1 Tax=Thermaurantimonas aggregans TaxID=2173829 RepID=UPI0023F2E721|nr:hypothetical protein [Thermaurantimonas aggregans]MCX8148036.1 hypothetical protein [Thermaurantimonas aggregans]